MAFTCMRRLLALIFFSEKRFDVVTVEECGSTGSSISFNVLHINGMNNKMNIGTERKVHVPILTDTEPETSIDLDVSLKSLNPGGTTGNTNRSVFNITLENVLDERVDKSTELTEYENRLKHEIKEWDTVWRAALQEVKRVKQKHPIIDRSILPPGKRAYLEKMPNLQKFIRDAVEFRQAANIFLEKDVEELIELQNNVIDVCDSHTTKMKELKIAAHLAKP